MIFNYIFINIICKIILIPTYLYLLLMQQRAMAKEELQKNFLYNLVRTLI